MKPHKSMKYMVAEKQVLIPLSACFFIIFLVFNFLFNTLRQLIQTTFIEVFDPKLFYLSLPFILQMNTHQYGMLSYMMVFITCLLMGKLIYRENKTFNV
ncbi:hypothetical protein P4679_20300 [Priestia megaterium]|uniref:hypothetical protein n=1 Tax=Priestia megaterium TaxID=1404 RepID=UPI002E1E368D|nr:hypothetical protein [Priestia megaterium]